ncbi:BREX-1 system adenine-specific DNA-methyltransferase PglX [Intestinibacter bartlettii]|uniref:BREX-1 system adenine-specific DNA-methyltransferase PglX n=1 Tax=Intestinibacter bartlettii TaxID=261299 RepID=UPI00242AD915|nr:BREX-1 system adenine-specific DNA-methyltransferase PglX [Intestinibacter bartlettii]MDU6823466.1 BREX-1 system adenine-specific DNA-methyltransferase PglX [Intestinibacter bartlettii]
MDKNAVKKFAVNARRKLIDSVSQKAYGLGISIDEIKEVEQIPNGSRIKINNDYVYLTDIETEHRERLIDQIEYKGYEQVMEEVAYTWFNRIIAIRFMEVNDYLPTRVRVLSSEDENKVEPDAVTQALELIEELGLDREKIYNYQDNNDTEGLFKYVFIKQCNVLGKIMPVMFEKIQDYTELLLPDNLLVEGSVIRDLINDIKADDFKDQVEIIGWLYQYYISEKKDEVFNGLKKNKKITKENIPAATQLFTPDWIVKYMVENSLGRLWLEGHPNEELKSGWKYYLEEAEQEPDVEKELEKIREESKKLSPEDITVLDPAMGSGHILVYAFDVLYQIYLSAGYSEMDIPRLILEKNLYGLDIDDRAGQLAYFALIMKARSYSRRFFRDIERNPIELNVCAIQESNGISEEDIEYFADGDEDLKRDVEYLVKVFTDAKDYGSILEVQKIDIDKINNKINYVKNKKINLLDSKNSYVIVNNFISLLKQYKLFNSKYDVCVTNPPYIGCKGINNKLKNYIEKNFKKVKYDLFSVCIERNLKYTKEYGNLGFMTPFVWLFISSYENLRNIVTIENSITSLIHLEYSAFEDATVPLCTFTLRKSIENENGIYIRLSEFTGGMKVQEEKFLESINFNDCRFKYITNARNFKIIFGNPIAYWASNKIFEAFINGKPFGTYGETKKGILTGNDSMFVRLWSEVKYNKICFTSKKYTDMLYSGKKWFPITNGGNYRKWYGNFESIVNLENDAYEIKNNTKNNFRLRDNKYYFKKSLTWTEVSSKAFSIRLVPEGIVFGNGGPTCFFTDNNNANYFLGLLNSKVVASILKILAPTINFGPEQIKRIPCIIDRNPGVDKLSSENICISKKEWDSFETSWDFEEHPIIEFKSNNIENSFKNWSYFAEKQFNQLKSNEEELNRIFIDIYGLQDELTSEVEEKDITIRKADRDREMKSFISYAVGCMVGRYSLDEEGLVFAGGEFDIDRYKTFKADKDAIIPITDMEYFEDDIVSRFVEFVKIVFGEETLEENLNYIADTECFKRKANETSRDCLRRYFLKGFIEDHIKVYQKRPIYWLFDSGKQNGFKALIYMHRYDENMVAKVRADYLHVLQRKYESEINRLDNDINSEILSTKEKTAAKKRKEKIQKQLAECKQYDQVIAHVAHQRITIDLDDGVKVNYQKFQGVEVPQGDGKKDLKQDLLFKVKM